MNKFNNFVFSWWRLFAAHCINIKITKIAKAILVICYVYKCKRKIIFLRKVLIHLTLSSRSLTWNLGYFLVPSLLCSSHLFFIILPLSMCQCYNLHTNPKESSLEYSKIWLHYIFYIRYFTVNNNNTWDLP